MPAVPVLLALAACGEWANAGAGDPADIAEAAVTGDPGAGEAATVENGSDDPAPEEVGFDSLPLGPRLEVVPAKAEFGGKKLGTAGKMDLSLMSVGEGAVTIRGIGQAVDWNAPHATPNPLFGLEPSKLSTGKLPIAGDPSSWIVVPAGSAETLVVSYTPGPAESHIDPITGQFVKDVTYIRIDWDGFASPLDVEASGYAPPCGCVMPVIVTEEGEAVPHGTVLHLHGDQSQPSVGAIKSYRWTVDQPPGNNFDLEPSDTSPNPTHRMEIGGEYTYCLDVCDAAYCSDEPKCHTTACKKVIVLPDQAIRCELTWDTPGDLDQFDECGPGVDCGSDMDLHFLHPFATGAGIDGDGKPVGWFDVPYDCFWYNPNPDWESMDPNAHDDPRLDRDDMDGAGPEVVVLDSPVKGRTYRVGVHYRDDHGYGYSYARVKCWVWGQQVLDINQKDLGVKMSRCDMWEVASIEWDTGKLFLANNIDGSMKITHKYQDPGGECE
jgi:hypothetical protein